MAAFGSPMQSALVQKQNPSEMHAGTPISMRVQHRATQLDLWLTVLQPECTTMFDVQQGRNAAVTIRLHGAFSLSEKGTPQTYLNQRASQLALPVC
jgi:hypothetical protein